jgi:prevent-host-death family protein
MTIIDRMSTKISIDEAGTQLEELAARTEDVILTVDGNPVAVLIGHERFEQLVERFQDALDRLSIYEAEGPTVTDQRGPELDIDYC